MKSFLLVLLLGLPLVLGACVSKNTYQQKVNETDLLTRDVTTLTVANDELRHDKQELQNDLSNLNGRLVEALQQNSKLQRDLLAAYATQERQEGDLTLHQQQIDAMHAQLTDMQQTNDQLLATIEELNRALEKEKIAREARLAKVKNTYNQLVGALEEEIKRGELTISNLEGQLSVNLLNKILFDSGKTTIKKEGLKVLQSLGDVLSKFPDKALQVAGHTDNVQISERLKERFPSNWELSTARATSVVHFLQDKVGLPGERIIAAGYGEYQPVASNDDAEGRALNRRIQILLVPFKAVAEKE
ncbi:chemotaxis protein MotB [Desulfuromusa kysingii]|uniref:Chemotaxis protein MotB n=1 Tax=Desulfuromusa kysingii TaxID=37625 RepID=A0A1H4BZ69_9BACT|nr:OmpA family protein [Desulfuromusa kysingii]SEA53495.1 chemotaxis protein MotB [Desulfuromusa kysingii]